MLNFNIFQNKAKVIPSSDEQIIRDDMEHIAIGGRKSHLPAEVVDQVKVSHVVRD